MLSRYRGAADDGASVSVGHPFVADNPIDFSRATLMAAAVGQCLAQGVVLTCAHDQLELRAACAVSVHSCPHLLSPTRRNDEA